jgi:hypothetical protein
MTDVIDAVRIPDSTLETDADHELRAFLDGSKRRSGYHLPARLVAVCQVLVRMTSCWVARVIAT